LVVTFVGFVVVALLRVKIVEFGFVGEVYLLDLLLVRTDLVFHVSLHTKKSVQVVALLIVLVLDVHVERFDVLGLRVRAMFVQSQVVIS